MIASFRDRLLRLLLLAAYLAVQGAPVHAHLHASHQHDSDRHAHAAVHAHQRGAIHADPGHADAIDSAHGDAYEHAASAADVDLDPETSCGKRCPPGDVASLPVGGLAVPRAAARIAAPTPPHLLPATPPPHPGQPRAPPAAA